MMNEIYITNSGINYFHYVPQSGIENSCIFFLLDISKHTGIQDANDHVEVVQNEYMNCFCDLFLQCCSCDQLKLDGGICKFEVEGIYVLNRVLPSSSMKFLRFPNAGLVMQQNMVPNLQSIIINDDTDCAYKNFHIPQCIKMERCVL